MQLTIVIPCFNEIEAIPKLFDQLMQTQQAFKRELECHVQIVVVDDGSTDGSTELLKRYHPKYITLIEHNSNRGYGAAIKEGVRSTHTEFVAFLDMDLTYDPKSLLHMMNTLLSENTAMVCGNRLAATNCMPFARRIGNKLYAWALSIIFRSSIKDSCTGIRLFRRSFVLPFIDLLPNGLDFTPGMTVFMKRLNIGFIELPVTYNDRLGNSKLSLFRDGLRFWKTIFKYSFIYNYQTLRAQFAALTK